MATFLAYDPVFHVEHTISFEADSQSEARMIVNDQGWVLWGKVQEDEEIETKAAQIEQWLTDPTVH